MKMTKRKWLLAACGALILAALAGGTALAAASPTASPAASPASQTADGYIGEDKAKAIALKHAGVSEKDATFTKVRLEKDDGRYEYELKFTSGDKKYKYEIDAQSGKIGDFSQKTVKAKKTVQTSAAVDESKFITQDEAKAIALKDAGLAESQVKKLKAKLDKDDGKKVYEVEFNSEGIEYEYDIDPVSGEILKSETEFD